jgi:hypothetical protein
MSGVVPLFAHSRLDPSHASRNSPAEIIRENVDGKRAARRRGLLPANSASAAVLGSSESLPQQGANNERYGRGGAASEQRLQARAQRCAAED